MAALQVTRVDLRLSANKKAHHTDAYASDELILRRGQEFSIDVEFNRPVSSGDNISLITETGPSPSDAEKTRVHFPFTMYIHRKDVWRADRGGTDSGGMRFKISSSVSAIIGRHTLILDVPSAAEKYPSGIKLGSFILLFNSWDSDDDVYMADDAERKEYVLNDHGIMYTGDEHTVQEQKWGYCQFEKNILDVCLNLLDQSNNHKRNPTRDVSQRNNPIYVCRVLAAMVNSPDDNGVVMENWSGDYSGGEPPTYWNQSDQILQQWQASGYKPVKYGQCFTFGGVLCTVLRCLGIPCRPVTNFNSAQDKDGNLYVEVCYDFDGTSADKCTEVLWSFHIWNEAWFVRKDLGSPYNGWQAINATPLEKSEGIYRCGPASVKAIKEGDVHLDYDTRFMYASVNADIAIWIYYSDGTRRKAKNNTKKVGKLISTKAVGSAARVDITASYKYDEGTTKEREVFKKAASKLFKGGPMAELTEGIAMIRASAAPTRDPQLSGEFKLVEPAKYGQDVKLALVLSNLTSDSMAAKVHFSSTSIMYTGLRKRAISRDSRDVPIGPKEEKHVSYTITYSQYNTFLSDDSMLKVVAICEVEKTDERVVIEKVIAVEKPPIIVKVPQEVMMNKAIEVEIAVTNPLSVPLEGCFLVVEGAGLTEAPVKKELSPVEPNKRMSIKLGITPSKTGTRRLLVNFTCNKLLNVKGSQEIEVKPNK